MNSLILSYIVVADPGCVLGAWGHMPTPLFHIKFFFMNPAKPRNTEVSNLHSSCISNDHSTNQSESTLEQLNS